LIRFRSKKTNQIQIVLQHTPASVPPSFNNNPNYQVNTSQQN
jgi:hypothetical protein